MKNESYVLWLQTDGDVSVQPIGKAAPFLEQLQAWVGGYIEVVPAKHGVLVINEEGKLDMLPVNEAATEMLRSDIWDVIRGDAVLLREDGDRLVGFSEVTARRIINAIRSEDSDR